MRRGYCYSNTFTLWNGLEADRHTAETGKFSQNKNKPGAEKQGAGLRNHSVTESDCKKREDEWSCEVETEMLEEAASLEVSEGQMKLYCTHAAATAAGRKCRDRKIVFTQLKLSPHSIYLLFIWSYFILMTAVSVGGHCQTGLYATPLCAFYWKSKNVVNKQRLRHLNVALYLFFASVETMTCSGGECRWLGWETMWTKLIYAAQGAKQPEASSLPLHT